MQDAESVLHLLIEKRPRNYMDFFMHIVHYIIAHPEVPSIADTTDVAVGTPSAPLPGGSPAHAKKRSFDVRLNSYSSFPEMTPLMAALKVGDVDLTNFLLSDTVVKHIDLDATAGCLVSNVRTCAS
jgi:hypothetical protein